MSDDQPSKRRGRPRVTDDLKKRHTLTFRMRDDLRDAIEEMAIIDKNTLSEQIESYVHAGVYAQAALMYQYEFEKITPKIMEYIKGRDRNYGLKSDGLDVILSGAAEHLEDLKFWKTDVLDEVRSDLPDSLRDRLKAEAEANKRSMNAEIVARLERTFYQLVEKTPEEREAKLLADRDRLSRELETTNDVIRHRIAGIERDLAILRGQGEVSKKVG